jgi:hypothetical protein
VTLLQQWLMLCMYGFIAVVVWGLVNMTTMDADMKLDILITKDQVTIEGQVVKRPAWYPPSAWVDFWERATMPRRQEAFHYDDN